MLRCFSLALFLLASAAPSPGLDWPNWRGPNYDGISREQGWFSPWPPEGPPIVWKTNVGVGYASFSVKTGSLYTLGNQDGEDTLFCLAADSGALRWKYSYPAALDPKYYAGGTSATPTLDGDLVYSLGKQGQFICLNADSGKVIWSKDLRKELSLQLPGWGLASSPIISGSLIILNAGQAGAAFERKTGNLVWSSGSGGAGYASAVPFRNGKEDALAVFAGKALVAARVTDGKVLWTYPWKTSYEVNAADPIVSDAKVFIASGYNRGSGLLDFSTGTPKLVWENKSLRSHCNAPVLLDGFLYGFDGDVGDKASLQCVDFKSGKVRWSQDRVGAGALSAADGKLIVLTHRCELIVAQASPEGFKPLARTQVMGGKGWTVPVLANGKIFCRNDRGDVVCVNAKGN